MQIRYAAESDIKRLAGCDKHIAKAELAHAVTLCRIYVAEENGSFAGWLRYNLFWDNTPFLNLLYLLPQFRGKGFGRQLLSFWEREMAAQGFDTLMTSTQSDEYAQHFYVKCGYEAVGGFRLPGDPYEVFFAKCLQMKTGAEHG